MSIKLEIAIILCTVILLLSCAHQMAPGGGPDDITGPAVISTFPSPESINIAPGSKITFTFSEWISNVSDRSISIFPPVKFKSKVTGNRLEIELLSKMAQSTTYHIEVNTSLKDLRNNELSIPYSLIFSTGNSLDGGSLNGCVTDPARKFLQPKIALFSTEQPGDSGVTGPPTYLLQTDSTGHFSFTHMKTGSYKIIGFLDANSDSRLQSGAEQVYIPRDSVINLLEQTPNITLYPALFDTSHPSIALLKATSNRVISGKWDKNWDSLVFNTPVIRIAGTGSAPSLQNFRFIQFPNSLDFAVLLTKPMEISQYRFICSISNKYDTSQSSDTILFNGINTADTILPILKTFSPSATVSSGLEQTIRLIWSEPVKFIDSILAVSEPGDSVWMKSSSEISDTSVLSPVKRMQPGTSYMMVILQSCGKDLDDNPLRAKDSIGDTAAIVTVKTVSSDSLATSLSGGADCLGTTENLKWFFADFNRKEIYISDNAAGQFRFDSIPAGNGNLGYFIDGNGNNVPDNGRLIPWIAPEPYVISSDTTEARAGWDIEGLNFPVCDPCVGPVPMLPAEK